MLTIKIDNQDYELDQLSAEAKAQLGAIQFCDQELARMQTHAAALQTAKNVYLWPGRTLFRKGLEAWLTLYLDALWSKQRTLEVYLNIVEWAPGVYGAEAAAQYHFRKSATALSADEAALLASVLPSPRRWSASKPGPYVRTRAQTIAYRATQMGDGSSCLAKK